MTSFRNKVKKNTPKVALDSIVSLIVATYKAGKTRLWKEVTEMCYSNPEEALLIAWESGYETWEIENILPIHEEAKSEDDAWKVWEYFKKVVVPDLVKEAAEGRVVKLIGFDTADKMIDAATMWILKDRHKKYGKQPSSLQEITTVSNGDENGWTALYDEINKSFNALRNAGYGIMSLAWTKEKETTLYNGLKYNSVELMMNNTARKIFESQASLICCLHNEVSVLDKDGNELEKNVTNKKGKELATNFHKTEVMMYFRPSEFVSIAGGRYTDLPEDPVPYSAENFMNVFKKAVEGQLKKTDKTVAELHVEQEEAKDQKAKEIVEQEDVKQQAIELQKLIQTELDTNWSNKKKGEHLVPYFPQKLGVTSYRESFDVEKLQEALEFVTNHNDKK